MTHMLKQNKGVHIESETEKDVPTQGDKGSTGCKDSTSLEGSVPGLLGPSGG